jgi:hypothetical protein
MNATHIDTRSRRLARQPDASAPASKASAKPPMSNASRKSAVIP